MATKRIDPTKPGQVHLYLDDLVREASLMTALQFKAFIFALAHEWRTGEAPESLQWRRLVPVPNGAKAAEIDSAAAMFADNPMRLKLVDERQRQITERQNKAKGQAGRIDNRGSQPARTASESLSESVSASASESLALKAKPNEISKNARKEAENLRDSSCLQSELLTNVSNSYSGGDAHAHAREAATGDSRLGGTLAEGTNSPNGDTSSENLEDLGDLKGPFDDFASQQAQLRAELEKIFRQVMGLVRVNAGRISVRVNTEISGLLEAGATGTDLKRFFGQRQRLPSLDYVASDFVKWKVANERGESHVNGTGSGTTVNRSAANAARERTERELSERDDSDADTAFAGRLGA